MHGCTAHYRLIRKKGGRKRAFQLMTAHSHKNFIKKQHCFEGTASSENFGGKLLKSKILKTKFRGENFLHMKWYLNRNTKSTLDN